MRRSKRKNKYSVVHVDNLSQQEPQQIPDAAQFQTQPHVIPQMPRQVQQSSLESDTVGSHPFQLQGSAGFIPAIMTRRRQVQKPLVDHVSQLWQSQRGHEEAQVRSDPDQPQFRHPIPREARAICTESHSGYPHQSEAQVSEDSADQLPRDRGPTKHNEIWNSSERLHVEFNKKGQPIGRWGRKLSSYLGTIARNGHMLPLTYHDWRAVPPTAKKNAWLLVLTKFELDASRRKTIMESLACKWRNWKSKLKTHYYKHASDDLIVERDDRVIEEQWLALVNYWNSDEGKKQSMTNKANRAKVKTYHTGGSRSFAQICEIEREKMPDGEEPSRAKIFILTHTRKDGQPVDATSATVISQLNELMSQQPENSLDPPARGDIFSRVMGTDKEDPSTYGTGIEASNLWGRPDTEGELTRASEAKQSADKEICKMQNKIEAMEENQKMMHDKMAAMEQNEKMMQDRVEAMEQDEKMTQDKMASMEQDQRMMKENQLRMELKYASIQGQLDMMVEAMLRNNTNVHLTDHMSTGQGCSTLPLASNQQPKNNKKQHREDCFTPSLAGNDQQKNNKRQRAEVRRKGQA